MVTRVGVLTDLPPVNITTLKEGISGGANQGRARDATREEVHCRADHREASRGRGRVGPREDRARGGAETWRDRADLLPRKREYGGLRTDQAKRLKDLEKENARLKRLLADAELDKAILREAASGNF